MGFFDRFKTETRNPQNPNIPVSAANFLEYFGLGGQSASGINVTIDKALGVPAIWTAVNFLSGTMAGLPVHLYRRNAQGRKRVNNKLSKILNNAVNDGCSSFDWRKHKFDQVFTGGRAYTFIEANQKGEVVNLWPLDAASVTVKRKNGVKVYEYKEDGKTLTYQASEIIDMAFMLKGDMLTHRSPITTNKEAIGKAIAETEYGSRFFQNGGVPPFAVTGNFQSGGAMKRAAGDLEDAVKNATKQKRQALVLPEGLKIEPIGSDAEKAQLVESQRFSIEQVARIYSLPPAFLQDLTHGTFSNTEQQDLQLVKHTLARWVKQFEQEVNLKLFGRSGNLYVEVNVDGLLRGDFKTRMEGNASAIQNAMLTPNEARIMDNREPLENGNDLLIQGATVPLGTQPKTGESNV